MWNRPKEVEQRKDQQYLSVLSMKIVVARDVEQAFDVEQPKDVEQAQRYGTGPKMWNGPKEVEQRKRSVMLFSAFGKK